MVDLERSTQLTSGPELRDVAANRSEYEPKAGLHYKATDTGAEFIGDGNRWNKIQSTGANPSFRSVDTDTLYNDDNPVTARVYKDGSTYRAHDRDGEVASGTDAGAVINSAISAVTDADGPGTGQKIAIARGRYVCSTTISLDDGTSLQGEGMRATVLEAADSLNADLIEYLAGTSTSDRDFFSGLFDLKLFGNKANNTSGRGLFIDNPNSQESNDFHMERVFVHKFVGDNIHVAFCWGLHFDHILSETSDGRGLNLMGGSQFYIGNIFTAYNAQEGLRSTLTHGRFYNIQSRSNGSYGVRQPSGGDAVTYDSCIAHLNDVHGFMCDASGLTFNNCIAVNNGQNNAGSSAFHLLGDDITIANGRAIDTQTTATQNYGLNFYGANGKVIGTTVSGSATTDVQTDTGASDTTLEKVDFGSLSDSGTRTRINGNIELGAAPTASNYSAADAGISLIDTSSTADPYDRYDVLQDGTLDGPY